MKTENTLARNLDFAADKASYDAACKRLLANKEILAWIMKSCIEEYRECSVKDIAEYYIEGEPQIAHTAVNSDERSANGSDTIRGMSTEDARLEEGTITYDIRFLAAVPGTGEPIRLIINVEAQNDFYPGYPIIKRGIYYCSRMISSQYGSEFTDGHYEKICKVYSIWICMNPPKRRKNTINRYSITEECMVGEEKEKKENYDLMTAVIICLGDSENEHYSGIIKLLDVLLSDEQDPQKKKHILEEDFSVKMTRDLEREVSLMCNLSKGIEDRGMEKGLEQGLEQGMEHGLLSSIRNLMEPMSWSSGQAMDALKIPRENRERYEQLLKQL